MADRTLLNFAQVASRLGLTVGRAYHKLGELEAAGFPKPIFGRMSGRRWDPVAIDRWLDSKISEPETLGSIVIEHEEWADRLDGRVPLVTAALGGK